MTPQELENAAEKYLSYVIWMLNQTAVLLAKPYSPEVEPHSPENNAYIESFVIHARILIEFLYGKPSGRDTILAANYVDNWWKEYISDGKPLAQTQFLKDTGHRADRMAAHLTRAGIEDHKGWETEKIRAEINNTILGFLDIVSDDKISKQTKATIRDLMKTPSPKGPVGTHARGPTGMYNCNL
jgi:hypothetical protein